jgi:hypothetical protein
VTHRYQRSGQRAVAGCRRQHAAAVGGIDEHREVVELLVARAGAGGGEVGEKSGGARGGSASGQLRFNVVARLRTCRSGAPTYRAEVLYQDPQRQFRDTLPNVLVLDPLYGWEHAVAFAPDGGLIVGSVLDGQVRFWNADGTPHASLRARRRRRW